MASNRIKGITIEIGGDTTGLDKALKSVNSTISDTKKELKEVEKSLNFNPGNAELLAQKQRVLGDAIEATTEKLNMLKKAQQQAEAQLANGTINQSQYDALNRELISTQNQLSNLSKSANENQNALNQANASATAAASGFGKFGNTCTNLGQALSGISAAAGLAAGGLVAMAKNAAETADEISTIATQTGLTTTQVQELQYASEQIDVPFEKVSSAITKMKGNLTSSQDAFAQIGVKIKDQNRELRSTDAIFMDCIKALSQIKNETERDTAAMKIFGKSADELAGLIDDGGAALSRLSQEAQNKGLIISDEDLEKANEFNNALDSIKIQIKAAFGSAGAKMAEALLPIIQQLAGAVSSLAEVIANIPAPILKVVAVLASILAVAAPLLIIIGQMSSGVSALISAFSGLPSVLSMVSAGFSQAAAAAMTFLAAEGPFILIAAAIVAALALIGYAIYELITHWDEVKAATISAVNSMKNTVENSGIAQFFNNQIDSMKTFATSGLDAIKSAFKESGNSISGIWNAGFEAIHQITRTVLRNITGLTEEQMQTLERAISNVWENVKNVISQKWNEIINNTKARVRDFVNSVVDAIKELPQKIRQALEDLKTALAEKIAQPFENIINKAKTWGKDLIENFIGGMSSNESKLESATQKMAQTIDDNIGFSEPKKGPLSDFHKNAPDMIDLWVKGIKENMYKVTNATTRLATSMNPGTAGVENNKPSNAMASNVGSSTMNVYVDHISELSDLIRIQNQAQQRSRMGAKA